MYVENIKLIFIKKNADKVLNRRRYTYEFEIINTNSKYK